MEKFTRCIGRKKRMKVTQSVKGERWNEWFGINDDCILLQEKAGWYHYRTGWYCSLGLRLENCKKLTEYPWVQVFINTPSAASVNSAKLKPRFMWWDKEKSGFLSIDG